MRKLLLILFSLIISSVYGQFNKSISTQLTGNFDLTLKGLATNDAGIGFGCDISFFAKHKLQIIAETNADYFFGDKLLFADSVYPFREGKRAGVYSIRAGPQFFICKGIAISGTYGINWYSIRDIKYYFGDGFKFSISGYLGARQHFIAKVFVVSIPKKYDDIQYLGFSAGYRF